MNPEQQARQRIDHLLSQAGWTVQSPGAVNLYASRGVAVREFVLQTGYGRADYLLYVDGKAAGAVEAKRTGATLTSVEPQSKKYSEGLPDDLPAWRRPLNPANRHERKETERFRPFTYDDLIKRDKANLDIFWLRDESVEDSASLPPPDVLAEEIVEDLRAALEQFEEIGAELAMREPEKNVEHGS